MPTIDLDGKRVQTVLPTAFTQGEQVTFTDDVSIKGKVVGEQSGIATVVRIDLLSGLIRFQNVVTFTLPEGQITAQGIFGASSRGRNRFTLAITGGTKKYDKIRGEIDVILDRGDDPPKTYTGKFKIKY